MVSCSVFVTRERAPVIRNFRVIFVATAFQMYGMRRQMWVIRLKA